MKGKIFKALADFYYVKSEGKIWTCKARGIFKKRGMTPLVGDDVTIEERDDGDAIITDVAPRKNSFIRPAVANVDCFIVVTAAAQPDPIPAIIDRFLAMAESKYTEAILCINKIDLVDKKKLEELSGIYSDIYPTFLVNATTGEGLDELKRVMSGKSVALAGSSGVGKSTILNAILPHASAQTGNISEKTKRGKHTTRHTEIFELPEGGLLYDTPGFTSFDIMDVDMYELADLYPEMREFKGHCRYDNCIHMAEPSCAVKAAVQEGKISESRYASYKMQIEILKEGNNV